MEILENNNKFVITCPHCKSMLCYEPADVVCRWSGDYQGSDYRVYGFTCPACGKWIDIPQR